MELILPIIALLVSGISLGWTAWSSRAHRQAAALVTNHTSIISVEAQIATLPALLRFHGIEEPEEELKRHGIAAEEFAYLLSNFTLGGTYYRTARKAKARTALVKGSYRYNMCLAPDTRRAWPLLRRMIDKSPYRDTLDEVFAELDDKLPVAPAAQQAATGGR